MSTMLLIERMPTLSIFARNHSGLGPTFTLSILRNEMNGHSFGAEISMEPAHPGAPSPGHGEGVGAPVSAAISLAKPKWLSRSPRFGVISTSKIVSSGNNDAIGSPIFASGERINNPSLSSESPSSLGLQSIPSDSTPRSLLGLIFRSPTSTAPGNASGTLSPTL